MDLKREIIMLYFLLFFGINSLIFSQPYSGSLGLRLGTPLGVTGKLFISERLSAEAILASSWGGLSATGLMKKYFMVKRRSPIYGFYGFGMHIGYWDNNAPWVDTSFKQYVYGIDLILGMEYVMDDTPFTISVDWMPAVHLNVPGKFHFLQLGISVRYYFY